MLTLHCPGLTSCLDLDYWAGVSSEELQTLSRQLRLNNVKLALSEEDTGELESVNSNLISLCTD